MEVRFEDSSLERLEADPRFTAGLDAALVKAFRKKLQFIRAAVDERSFYAMKSLHYEKLKGDRDGQRSMRLNDQWRLILRIEEDDAGRVILIVSIADYH
ncbi:MULTISPECIES: type II toxin-antitoxin system RelE/ParE family toxin [Xanthomonas]|uniref:type II toxin-antitoxin system RelE/ParE family toxin n=1 Tax=Xanthomonas TaxID=338 RepID=UPI001E40DCE8|nr:MULTISPECIES: type II toxin-antitoxin system RelE/ParE family toxin [Xanthomonas]MCC8628050.1 type II toxin-antitoxin system RelE/ParE family toxin [Xanthomonas vesicatoria]MCL1570884.1 type II toxin-antitoxin system RelE/ParE family toxin [Xanthomonas nasturtii]MCL1574676.1 type II toxin-antitoxin system RelE/ParE family toxin [Xanthomonas nasturtii]MCL1586303.1 type II toxin-antitoxin system RelE/ParE family toxin [Xanthomonas nasturtii]MCL1662078.1 type II toxin-antitoxin system RelE/Par